MKKKFIISNIIILVLFFCTRVNVSVAIFEWSEYVTEKMPSTLEEMTELLAELAEVDYDKLTDEEKGNYKTIVEKWFERANTDNIHLSLSNYDANTIKTIKEKAGISSQETVESGSINGTGTNTDSKRPEISDDDIKMGGTAGTGVYDMTWKEILDPGYQSGISGTDIDQKAKAIESYMLTDVSKVDNKDITAYLNGYKEILTKYR